MQKKEVMIKRIRAKCIEVNGENMFIGSFCSKHRQFINEECLSCRGVKLRDDMELADVLLALKSSSYPYRIAVNVEGFSSNILIGSGNLTLSEFAEWDLKKPMHLQDTRDLEIISELLK